MVRKDAEMKPIPEEPDVEKAKWKTTTGWNFDLIGCPVLMPNDMPPFFFEVD